MCHAEINYDLPLPPPKPAAQDLKNRAVETVQKWYDKFAEGYRKLALGYNFLKKCRKVKKKSLLYKFKFKLKKKKKNPSLSLKQKLFTTITIYYM